MTAVVIPACCNSRKGSPAFTAQSWPWSPTSTPPQPAPGLIPYEACALLCPYPCHARAPSRGIVAPRLQHRLLDPVERRSHRLVVAAQHRPVAARMPLRRQRRQHHRLRCRKRDVETRAVLVPALPPAPRTDVRPANMALQAPPERACRNLRPGLSSTAAAACPCHALAWRCSSAFARTASRSPPAVTWSPPSLRKVRRRR